MSYSDGEQAILEQLREMRAFDRHNSSRGDWKPLNSGASACYAVLRAGEFTVESAALNGASLIVWRTVIEVWQRWKDDAPTVMALEELVSDTIWHLERYATLGGEALMARVSGGSEMQQRWREQGGPAWAVQEVYLDWQEERFYDTAE